MNTEKQPAGEYMGYHDELIGFGVDWGVDRGQEINRLNEVLEASLQNTPAFSHLTFAPVDGLRAVVMRSEVWKQGKKIQTYPTQRYMVPLLMYAPTR